MTEPRTTCLHCGVPITQPWAQGRRKFFCSRACCQKERMKRIKRERLKLREQADIEAGLIK